jgi:Fe-S cluster biogenesis protein NfuA
LWGRNASTRKVLVEGLLARPGRGPQGPTGKAPEEMLGSAQAMGPPRDEILEIVRELVGPLVRADAGQLYVVSCGERSLSLHLTGRFSGCPGNTLAKRRVIEPLLLARFPDLKIEISSGPLLPDGAELV